MNAQVMQNSLSNATQSTNAPSRTSKYSAPFLFNPTHYLSSLRKTAAAIIEPKELTEETQVLLHSICQKFIFGDQTLALGLHYYQTLRQLHSHEKFWASSCLIVAGKAGELDKNVPYLNRYQRYADKSFSQADYQHAERSIFEALGFDLQYSTFISFLDFFLARGVIFPSDSLSDSLVELFESDSATTSREFLRNGTFTQYQPEMLALSIIKQTREKYGLTPWPQELQILTGKTGDEIKVFNSSESQVLIGLKELTLNQNINSTVSTVSVSEKEKEREKGVSRKKYEYKPHFASIHKFKENSFSSSKMTLQSRKASQPFVENFSTLNTDMIRRR